MTAHSQTGWKRKRRQREADLPEIARLWARGLSLQEIASEISKNRPYSLSFQTISKDVRTNIERWKESIIADVGEMRAGELARINQIEREAWEAWEKSKQIAERKITGRKTGSHEGTVAQLIQEAQCGDPRYLDKVQWCISKRCELLGLNAPQKIAPTTPDGDNPYLAMPLDDLKALALKLAGGASE